jgi:hypothetical protein
MWQLPLIGKDCYRSDGVYPAFLRDTLHVIDDDREGTATTATTDTKQILATMNASWRNTKIHGWNGGKGLLPSTRCHPNHHTRSISPLLVNLPGTLQSCLPVACYCCHRYHTGRHLIATRAAVFLAVASTHAFGHCCRHCLAVAVSFAAAVAVAVALCT